ncbi:MAG: PHB depolymerase family esterase [Gemmatimonadaceae bacterium]
MSTRRRHAALAVVLTLIAAPALIAAVSAVRYHATNRSTHSMVSGGLEREYSLHVPVGYDGSHPVPLVISMHGAGLWPAAQMMISRWNDVADSVGAIVVYPSAIRGGGPVAWRATGGSPATPDVRFIGELIDTLSARYRIDPSRIYADGVSNGGGMAFVLSCTMSGRIAAVGMVGPAHLLPFSACTDTTPVPMMHIHGTEDTAAPYNGGSSWVARQPFANIPRWVASWAQRNKCKPTPRDSAVTPNVVRRSYDGCADGADVVLYTIHGAGHTWPGGTPLAEWFVGTTSSEMDASLELWRFFNQHPLGK